MNEFLFIATDYIFGHRWNITICDGVHIQSTSTPSTITKSFWTSLLSIIGGQNDMNFIFVSYSERSEVQWDRSPEGAVFGQPGSDVLGNQDILVRVSAPFHERLCPAWEDEYVCNCQKPGTAVGRIFFLCCLFYFSKVKVSRHTWREKVTPPASIDNQSARVMDAVLLRRRFRSRC